MSYAQVAVDAAAPQKLYTYSIPPGLNVTPGQAVWVPFGRNSPQTQGIVFQLTDTTDVPELKPIESIIESQPLLTQAALDLALWISDYYFAPLFDCAALMMPPGFRQRVRTTVQAAADPTDGVAPRLSERARTLLDFLRRQPRPLDLNALRRRFGPNTDYHADVLLRQGLVLRESELQRPRVSAKFQRVLRLTPEGAAAELSAPVWARRAKQRAVLEWLQVHPGEAPLAEVSEALGEVSRVVALLEQAGLVALRQERVSRDPLVGRALQTGFVPTLTLPQASVWDQIAVELDAPAPRTPILLHGVTGSGKTELYLRALEAVAGRGQRAIVLVPEIALEPQTVSRFSARFPGRVAVLHSGLSAGEAYDEWWHIRDGEFDVVIGSRSAIFAPQPDLGLIIVDEEHEMTYKQQEPSPRYHARRVAHELAQRSGALLLLGSATPDLESYVAALEHRQRLVELPERIPQPGRATILGGDNRGLPQVQVVDLRDELKAGNRSIFSRALQAELAHALKEGQQAMLFLNRRGSATFVQCRDCGYVVRCRRCDTPLGYHSAGERLICHQCNLQRGVPTRCPECRSVRIRFLGAGTQRVEQEMLALFPRARVLRWDRDVTQARRSHEELLERFIAHEADVLVGTQMIAKGLDIPNVTLVGVVNADVNLYLPDFRAAERTFQLLTQVAGRAGRGVQRGTVIIQTYTPDHYAIRSAARQDYGMFVHQEMAFRHRYGYPPFQPLLRLLYADTSYQRAERTAVAYARDLMRHRAELGLSDVQVLGPSPAFLRRMRGRYRWQVLLKGSGGHALVSQFPPARGWIIDVDPAHVL